MHDRHDFKRGADSIGYSHYCPNSENAQRRPVKQSCPIGSTGRIGDEKEMEMYSLKTARERKGLKQSEAARLLGVSVATLGNYESGKSYPDVPVIRKIEAVYNVPYSQLIFLPLDYDKTVNVV